MNENCIFCKIASGEIPCAKVYEDEKVFAFVDIQPVNPGHLLVIPKEHYKNIYETPDDILANMMAVVKKFAILLKEKLGAEGINIGMNNDSPAGQLVFHSHIHIIPRTKDDGLKHWPGKEYQEGEIEKIQEALLK